MHCSPSFPRRPLFWLGAALCLALASAAACAAYPEKPVRLIVPYPPGGATDVIARIVANRLGAVLGQPVVVENKAGAGGNLGAEAAARAPADGYSLLLGALTSHAVMMTLERGRLRYDLVRDFTPLMVVGTVPLVVVVHNALPVKSLAQLVAYGRAHPGALSFASSGAGSPQRLAAEILIAETGIKMVHVPYKGSGPALTDLVGGQVQMMIETVPAALPFIQSGQLRALAVTTAQPLVTLPDVPTTAEAGFAAIAIGSTFGVLAPSGTPAAIAAQLNAALARVITDGEVQAQLLRQGVQAAAPTTLAQAGARVVAEVARWQALIDKAAIKAD